MPQTQEGWEVLEAIVDSGATVPVIPGSVGKGYEILEGAASRAGVSYEVANGEFLPNLGEKNLAVITQEGTLRGYSTQVADVSKPLQSVRHLHKSGHVVVFDGPDSFMVNKYSGEVNEIGDDGVNYLMQMLIVPQAEISAVQQHFTRQAAP